MKYQHGKVISVELIAQSNAQVQEGPLGSCEGAANLGLNSLQGFANLSHIAVLTFARTCAVQIVLTSALR